MYLRIKAQEYLLCIRNTRILQDLSKLLIRHFLSFCRCQTRNASYILDFFLIRMKYLLRLFTMTIYNVFVTQLRGHGTVLHCCVLVFMKYCEYHVNVFGLSFSAVNTTCTICYSTCQSSIVRQCLVQTPLCVTIRSAPGNRRHLQTILLFKSIWQSHRNVRYFFKITISVIFIYTQREHRRSHEPWHHMYSRFQML